MKNNKTRAPQPELFYLEGANREEKEERMRTTAYKEERQLGFL